LSDFIRNENQSRKLALSTIFFWNVRKYPTKMYKRDIFNDLCVVYKHLYFNRKNCFWTFIVGKRIVRNSDFRPTRLSGQIRTFSIKILQYSVLPKAVRLVVVVFVRTDIVIDAEEEHALRCRRAAGGSERRERGERSRRQRRIELNRN